MKDIQKIADSFESLVKHMLEHPDKMILEICLDGTDATFRVSVAQRDVGVLIGKEGRVARSLRTILTGIGMKTKQRINLDIIGTSR
jgi:hypothetical protein